MVNDPIGDFIARFRNAAAVKEASLELPYSRFVETVAGVLKETGYLSQVKKFKEGSRIKLHLDLAYGENQQPLFNRIDHLSKPGRRIYRGSDQLRKLSREGVVIVSTSRGVLSGKEAHRKSLGGEVLCILK